MAAFRGSLQVPVGPHVRRSTGRAHRLDEQVPVLGGRRSGKMGPRRLCLHSCRQPRRRPLAGRDRYLVVTRSAGSRLLRRVGRNTALVERQSRPQRHFLLRAEPMADVGAATETPGRDLHLGRRGRFLSRHGASWRNIQSRLRAGLVEGAGLLGTERPRHARLQEPHERRLGVGARDAVGTTTRPQSPRFLRGLYLAQARYRSRTGSPACRTGPR